jgi:hypothetical protein
MGQGDAGKRYKRFITQRGIIWFVVFCVATALVWGLFVWGSGANTGSGGDSVGSDSGSSVSVGAADALCAPLANTAVLNRGGSSGVAILDVLSVRGNERNVPGLDRFLQGMSLMTPVVECDFGDLGSRTCDGEARYLLTADGKRRFTYPCGYRTPFGPRS